MCRVMFKLAFCFSLICAQAFAAPVKKSAMEKARALYSAGNYAGAAQVYEGIRENHPDFLRSREELAWAYLQSENWVKLRGILPDLNSKLVPLRWRLEGRVLSAMLSLKDCNYQKVKMEIEMFQKEMAPLARTVDQKAAMASAPPYWAALKAEMQEALFKMKFVRMEMRSRLVMLTREQVIETPASHDKKETLARGAQVFPVNDDYWSDEVFEKRGEGQSICAAVHKAKVIQ